jgi:hypothetical protein
VSSGWREAAVNVLVEEHFHAVALDEEGVVVISPLLPFTQPLTVLWLSLRGPSAGRPARRAAQVVDATLFLRVLQSLQERTPTTATGTTGVYHTANARATQVPLTESNPSCDTAWAPRQLFNSRVDLAVPLPR